MQAVDSAPPLKAGRPPREKEVLTATTKGQGTPRSGGKPRAKKAEPPLTVHKKTFAVLDGRVVSAGQGRTYWNVLCTPPDEDSMGKIRSAKFVFSPWNSAAGAVGMLPPAVNSDDLSDWLGWQTESVALWLDGTCRQNGSKRASVDAVKAHTEGDTLLCKHMGTKLIISRGGDVIKTFHDVPANWCFATGAFGGSVSLLRESEEDGFKSKQPRIVLTDIIAFKVPDGDQGTGRTDVFVEFQLLNHDGSPSEPFPDRRPRRVTTCALAADGDSTCVFQDQLALLLPDQYTQDGGLLSITVYDDDLKAADDKLGMSTIPLIFTPANWPDDVCNVDQHVLTGQRSLAGHDFPDLDISFKMAWVTGGFH